MEATDIHFETLTSARIDIEKGVVYGVSVITEGVVKGHNVLADKKTLKQMQKAAEAFEGGVKVKLNHWTGVDSIVGALRSFSVKGRKLIADLHLLKTHDKFSTLLEMIQEMPDSFGLSVSYSGKAEDIAGISYARCEELYSVDLVDQPAANPSGLFSSSMHLRATSKSETTAPNMPEPTSTPAPAPAATQDFSALTAQLTQLSAEIAALKAAQKASDPDKRQLSELTVGELRDLIAKESAKQFQAVGVPAASATANPNAGPQGTPPAPAPKTFEAVVSEKLQAGMKKGDAIKAAIESHPAEYLAARTRGIKSL